MNNISSVPAVGRTSRIWTDMKIKIPSEVIN
jgi:hypothetical protein